ncbi:MAG: hypothetical protein WCH79_08515, partial [Planctomycetia bacterium]
MPDSPAIDPAAAHEIASHKHERPLVSCAWDPLGRFVLFGSEDSDLHRLGIDGLAAAAFTGAHDSWVRA